ncbi:hypothetical protein GCM10017673_14970 [Streptosporangium violaceochromogenes]|nr:hypothetical protein GCM10017673_14970 [Streptosporangium violaceochromogenes]
MALTVGELTAYAQLDTGDFTSGTQAISSDLNRLQSSTSSAMSSMESTAVRSLDEIEQAIADGFDPDEAMRDLDRLHASLDAALDQMSDDLDDFDETFDAIMSDAFDELDDDAREAGRRAGDDIVDGLRDELDEAERIARREGEEVGEEFGDGVDEQGRSRMSGVGTSLMDGLKGAGIGLALAAGAAIGAALMNGLEGALDAEAAKQKLFAQVGASEGQMRKLGSVAGRVYADAYGESMGDVTEAIRSVVQNMDGMRSASEASLGSMTKRAMDVGAILDEDVSQVTRAVAKILKTDLAGSANEAFDILVRGAQRGGNEAEDLLDTYSEYSTQFRSMGLSGQQAMGLIVQGLRAGARDADIVADTIKEFTIEAVKGGDAVKKGFTHLGLSADDMVAKFAKGGPTAAAAFDTVLDKLRNIEEPAKRNAIAVELFGTKAEDMGAALFALDPSKAVNSLGQVDGAAKKAGDTLHDTAANKLEQFKRGFQTGLVDFLGGTVIPKVEEFVTWIGENFNFAGTLETVQGWAASLGEIWDSIVADVQEWVNNNKSTIDEWTGKFQEGFASISEAVNTALGIIKELWAEYGDEIIVSVTFLVDTFLNIWNGFWGFVSGALKIAKGILTGDMDAIKEGLSKIWESLWNLVKDTVTTGLKAITGLMGESWDDMKSKAETAWKRLVTTVTSKVSETVAEVQKLPGKIKAFFANASTWLLQAGKDVIQGLIKGIQAKAAEAAAAAKGVADLLTQAAKVALVISSPSKKFEEIGKWTVQGLIKGLEGEGANVKSTIDKMVEDIKKAFGAKADITDHLLEFVRTGNKNLEDLALQRAAIVQKLADAKEYALKVAGSAKDFASITGLKLEEHAGASDIATSLKSKAQAIKDFANDIKALAKAGLNKATLQQIIDAGVEKGSTLADMLVGAPGSEIKAINKAQKQIDNMSKQLGKNSADALYDVGKKAGDGYLKGLQDSLKKLDKEMEKIADALINAIKKRLKIKSPSQVMAEIGGYTVAGLIQGIQAREGDAVASMTALITKAVAASVSAGSVGKAAKSSTTKIPINNATAIAGHNADGGNASAWGDGGPRGGAPIVNVSMPNATIREEADVAKLGRDFGFELAVQA